LFNYDSNLSNYSGTGSAFKPGPVHRRSHARIPERVKRIHEQNEPINICPDNYCDRKHAMERKLKLATWNANRTNSLKVKAFIFSQDIDILLAYETHFTNKNYRRIPGYTLYRTMYPDGKTYGETALIIRSSIKYYKYNIKGISCRLQVSL